MDSAQGLRKEALELFMLHEQLVEPLTLPLFHHTWASTLDGFLMPQESAHNGNGDPLTRSAGLVGFEHGRRIRLFFIRGGNQIFYPRFART